LRDFPVQHIVQTVGQVIAVASVNGYAFHAFSVELTGSRTGAVIQARLFDLGQKLVLQFTRASRISLFEQFHGSHFHGVVVDGHHWSFAVRTGW
jgi:hypothetical protein